jgi:Insertion element 4 transposase N-terminal
MPRTIGRYPELSALSRSLDVDWITQALAITGKASVRKRKLPAEQVVWLVIALALYRHQSIPEVVAHLDLWLPDEINPDIAKSALTQARQRLGRAPLAQLFGMSASCWDERHQSGKAWRGLEGLARS